jgi:hypothetical protein
MTTFRNALVLVGFAILLGIFAGCGGGEDLGPDVPDQPPPVINCNVTPRPAACI